uniref:Invertebrate defensins family profile domain-containing protein n=1 Tax=Anguilla anguilla TaxID=7936 RepID=A0A0E9T8A6_ANGAN
MTSSLCAAHCRLRRSSRRDCPSPAGPWGR